MTDRHVSLLHAIGKRKEALRAAHIYGPSPQPTHFASADPADHRVFCPAADGQLAHAYTAISTAALLPLGQPTHSSQGKPLCHGMSWYNLTF